MSPQTRIGAATIGAVLGLALLGCSDTARSTPESSTTPPPPAASETSPSTPVDPPADTTTSATVATDPPTTSRPEYVDTGLPFAGLEPGDVTSPIVSPLADGVYFAESARLIDGGTAIEFVLRQRFSGDACAERFGTEPASCPGGVDFGPETASASMAIGDGSATVIGLNATGNPIAFEVSQAELARLLGGEPPATGAPAGFSFVPYPFIVTVTGGEVVTADQQFQS